MEPFPVSRRCLFADAKAYFCVRARRPGFTCPLTQPGRRLLLAPQRERCEFVTTIFPGRAAGSRAMTPEQRRALQMLAGTPRGITDAAFLAHGFTWEMAAGLVLAGLVTVVTETVRAGGPTIKVERIQITDEGRTALDDSAQRS